MKKFKLDRLKDKLHMDRLDMGKLKVDMLSSSVQAVASEATKAALTVKSKLRQQQYQSPYSPYDQALNQQLSNPPVNQQQTYQPPNQQQANQPFAQQQPQYPLPGFQTPAYPQNQYSQGFQNNSTSTGPPILSALYPEPDTQQTKIST
jgi:hypothetical protein